MDKNKKIGTLLILAGLGSILIPLAFVEDPRGPARSFLAYVQSLKLVLVKEERPVDFPPDEDYYADAECVARHGNGKYTPVPEPDPEKHQFARILMAKQIAWIRAAQRLNIPLECLRIRAPTREVSIPYGFFLATGIITLLAGVGVGLGAVPIPGRGS